MPCKLAITSMSLGRCYAGHSLTHKLDMASLYGYKGIELSHEDLADVAKDLPPGPSTSASTTADRELEAARTIRQLCRERGLAIVCLQPFMHYEGLRDRREHRRRLDKLAFWFRLARALGTDMIQVPSNFLPAAELSPPTEEGGEGGEGGEKRDTAGAVAVADLREIAEMGLRERPPVRFAYEALCWGTRCDTWERSWEVVRAVDRPNFGVCLDTFNIAGRIYADPSLPSGRAPGAHGALRDSIARLVASVDVGKVFYVQVVDAERLAAPLLPGHAYHVPGQPARMSWSRNCRLFYGEAERGAYLPVADLARAVFRGLGFEGWVSMELFNRRMEEACPDVPRELAARGAAAWAKLVRDMELRVVVEEGPDEGRVAASL